LNFIHLVPPPGQSNSFAYEGDRAETDRLSPRRAVSSLTVPIGEWMRNCWARARTGSQKSWRARRNRGRRALRRL